MLRLPNGADGFSHRGKRRFIFHNIKEQNEVSLSMAYFSPVDVWELNSFTKHFPNSLVYLLYCLSTNNVSINAPLENSVSVFPLDCHEEMKKCNFVMYNPHIKCYII